MDLRTFWLIGFVVISLGGASLTAARRYKNDDSRAGYAIAGWTIFLLILWVWNVGNFLK